MTGIVWKRSGSLSYLIQIDNGQLWRRHFDQITHSVSKLSFDSITFYVDTIILITSYHLVILSKLSKLWLLPAIVTHNSFDDPQIGTFDISNCCISFNYYLLFKGGEIWYVCVMYYYYYMEAIRTHPRICCFCSVLSVFVVVLSFWSWLSIQQRLPVDV